jgi:putative flavoprotein involved in K+ transport
MSRANTITESRERIHTVIVGGGQAGLSVGYFLKRRGVPFVILDANARIGDSWRMRWDSLRLFTPAQYDGLAGMPFPARAHSFPTKDEMADYLEAYAARFALPVRTGARVSRLWREGTRYLLAVGERVIEAEHVVIAMGSYQAPRIPSFAVGLSGDVRQLHSSNYTAVDQLRPGGVLVVGAGNSGAEIAFECARAGRATWLSGRDVGQVPFRIESRVGRVVQLLLFRLVFHRLLSVATPIGRRARMRATTRGTPLIRRKLGDLQRAGVERVGRVSGVRDGKPLLDDGRTLDVANVIWCTGFEPALSWIDLPIFDARGEPMHDCGLVPTEAGISFVGQHFLYAMSSAMIHGVARDAERIARAISEAESRDEERLRRGAAHRRTVHDERAAPV